MPDSFTFIEPGLEPELNSLDIDDVQHHYATLLHDFIVDEPLGIAYMNRMLAQEDLSASADGVACMIHLMGKALQLMPFNAAVRSYYAQVFQSADDKAKAVILGKQAMGEKLFAHISELSTRNRQEEAHRLLYTVVRESGSVCVAQMVLLHGLRWGLDVHAWLDTYTPHPLLAQEWNDYVVMMLATHGHHEKAVELWEARHTPQSLRQELVLNYVATSYARLGHAATARELYARSLMLDPTQDPVRHLIAEIDAPFVANAQAVRKNTVPILIYSYNKDQLLEMTLDSVCQSDIGDSDIIVLLNGCTDNSLQVVRAVAV